jgi:hypothetical protein
MWPDEFFDGRREWHKLRRRQTYTGTLSVPAALEGAWLSALAPFVSAQLSLTGSRPFGVGKWR